MEPTAQGLARTYSDRVYPDPWEKVLDYRRVQAYAAEHPKHGRTRVGNALDLPPSRVRGWINGGMPDPVRGIQTAITHGWLDPDPNSDIAAALVELLAHVLAGGSITHQTLVPAVTTGRRIDRDDVRAAFERVGVDTVIRHSDTDGRATEVLPTADASVLGRCLVAMGAPAGEKVYADEFPSVVWEVPKAVRESFARIYVAHRATQFADKRTMAIPEDRSLTYLKGIRDLLADVTGESVTASDHSVTISADAARVLYPGSSEIHLS
ncbi:hypothetical protein U4E84_01700 [Halorubrum sp. AD140]|uniref:hypothetical protein n=1 Tax=Halorubrum sp. AD140 TaxID=3050073 RepID=UPI002ACC680A|nr:hypothetical protein [Halorubrum sp. AD140]MDZ5810069.1 hypothetical protein [Halorubrum sp. AD140]